MLGGGVGGCWQQFGGMAVWTVPPPGLQCPSLEGCTVRTLQL